MRRGERGKTRIPRREIKRLVLALGHARNIAQVSRESKWNVREAIPTVILMRKGEEWAERARYTGETRPFTASWAALGMRAGSIPRVS
jgi:hypothetical protein